MEIIQVYFIRLSREISVLALSLAATWTMIIIQDVKCATKC